MAELARDWGVHINFSPYTWLRTNDKGYMIPKDEIPEFGDIIDKLARIKIYRDAIGIKHYEIPAHNTFNALRQRLGPEGFVEIHRHFVLQAYKLGLLTPPISDVPKMVRDKIILIGDSTFLKAVASTKGEKDDDGNWISFMSTRKLGNGVMSLISNIEQAQIAKCMAF